MQISGLDVVMMREALRLASIAQAQGEVPVGAVVACGETILGRGWNAPISTQDPTAHAEVMALRDAARCIRNYRLPGCTLYVTLEPCAMCAGAIIHARIARVVFGTWDKKTGACGSILNLFEKRQLNHHATVEGGLLGEECSGKLLTFFRGKRGSSV